MPVTIRPMTRDDLDPAVLAVLEGGWGDRRTWFEFALAHPACVPIVAVDGREIVGTGAGTRNGRAGWVGTIFVVPERRREGIGRALSEAVCDRLEADGCETLVLVASDEGRPVYERLGFAEAGWYRTLEAEGTGTGLADPGIRPFRPPDIGDAADLDAAATGEDRTHLLEAFASIPGGLALRAPSSDGPGSEDAGELRGFLVRAPWGGGGTVALSLDDGERLLAARLALAEPGHRVRAGLLESNEEGLRRLAEPGWSEVRRILRMERGAPLDWHPERIWGQFNFALG